MNANLNQVRAALDAPHSDVRLYILHGPDEAGARALAERLARAMGPDSERIDLDGSQLKAAPARLVDEARSFSLFGGRRHIRITAAGEECLEAFELLLAADQADNPVVALAPGLKATGKVLKLAAASPSAMAAVCYPPVGADADRLVAAIGRELGLRIDADTARRLMAATGNERAVVTREIEKLALFLDAAPERPRDLSGSDIDAVGADSGEAALSPAIDAILHGRVDQVAAELAGLQEGGASMVPLLRALVRRLMVVAELRAETERGGNPAALIQRIFWKERDSTTALARKWSSPRISAAIARVRTVERDIMSSANAGNILVIESLVTLARQAARTG